MSQYVAGGKSRTRRELKKEEKKRDKANAAELLLHQRRFGLCYRAKEHSRGDEQRWFYSLGNCCVSVCLRVRRHQQNTHKHTHSEQYNVFKFINTRVRGEKNSTVKPNTTFPALSADNLKTSLGQCKHTAQNTQAHRWNAISPWSHRV